MNWGDEYAVALDVRKDQDANPLIAREAEPTATAVCDRDSVTCPRCNGKKQRADWIVCIGCAVSFDAAFAEDMAKARDVHRAWLEQADPLLEIMDRESPLYVAGMAQRAYHLKQYKALCHLVPEVVA